MSDPTNSTAQNIAAAVEAIAIPAANIFAPVIGGATVEAIVQLAAKYGPGAVSSIIALFHKSDVTTQDVLDAFAPLKAYEDYKIPAKVP